MNRRLEKIAQLLKRPSYRKFIAFHCIAWVLISTAAQFVTCGQSFSINSIYWHFGYPLESWFIQAHGDDPTKIIPAYGIVINPLIWIATSAVILSLCLLVLRAEKKIFAYIVSLGSALLFPSLFFLMYPRVTMQYLEKLYCNLPNGWYTVPLCIAGGVTVPLSSAVFFLLLSRGSAKRLKECVEHPLSPGCQ